MSETTEIKGQFGLGQSGGTGKKLKIIFILQMSSYYQPCRYSKRQINLQLTNTYCQVHSLNCNCNKPLQHIILQILEQEPSLKEDKEFTTKLQQCLSTGDTGVTHEDDFGGIGDGDLERLFAEDFGEEDDTR